MGPAGGECEALRLPVVLRVNRSARWEEQKQCLLVLIRADADGNKELVGHSNGYRESEQL